MKIRELWRDELRIIQLMMFEQGHEVSIEQLRNAYDKAVIAKAVDDNGLQGFIMIRKLGIINELSYWHLKPEHSLLLKGLARKLRPVGAHEPPINKERLKILESAGFKSIGLINGLLKNSEAVILRRD